MVTIQERLTSLATEFETAADEYDRELGRHNGMLADEMRRSATVLRFAGVLVDETIYTPLDGYLWWHAGRKVMNQVTGANA
jgi:hypothetical protein